MCLESQSQARASASRPADLGTRLLAGARLWEEVYRGRTRGTPLRVWLPNAAGARSLGSAVRAVDYSPQLIRSRTEAPHSKLGSLERRGADYQGWSDARRHDARDLPAGVYRGCPPHSAPADQHREKTPLPHSTEAASYAAAHLSTNKKNHDHRLL